MFNGTHKAQSALEYLMTYGWAILIIGVVLGALFSLGVFNGSPVTACIAVPGYECQQALLGTGETLAFTLGQSTGATLYNVQMACETTSNALGLPVNGVAFNAISLTGTPLVGNAFGNSLITSETLAITGWPCYSNGVPPSGTYAIGTTYTGYLWLNYTTGSGVPSNTATANPNPYYTVKIATMSLKVS